MERVEMITRTILDVHKLKTSENVQSRIVEEVIDDEEILVCLKKLQLGYHRSMRSTVLSY